MGTAASYTTKSGWENLTSSSINLIKSDLSILVPQVVILGPPASGKKTMAKLCASKLRTAHLTEDNMVAEAETETKLKVQEMNKKKQVKH